MKKLSPIILSIFCSACDSSMVGPDIGKNEKPTEAGDDPIPTPPNPQPPTPDPTPAEVVTCSRTTGKELYFYNESINIIYTCDNTLTKVDYINLPSFLNGVISGAILTISGTAPNVFSNNSWSFSVNQQTTTSGGENQTTVVSTPGSFSTSLNGTFDLQNYNDANYSFTLTGTIAGDLSTFSDELTLSTNSINTNMYGLTYFATCDNATSPYVCYNQTSKSNLTITNAMTTKWKFGAFDQGDYYLSLNPRIYFDNSFINLDVTNQKDLTIPIQSNGNILIANPTTSMSTYYDLQYPLAIAIGHNANVANPNFAACLIGSINNIEMACKEVSINRQTSAVNAPYTIKLSKYNNIFDNTKYINIVKFSTNHWIAIGSKSEDSKDVLFVNRFVTADFANSNHPSGTILTPSNMGNIHSVTASKSFVDTDQTERIAVAFIHQDSIANKSFLHIGKINPLGTNTNSYIDDGNYKLEKGSSNGFRLNTNLSFNQVDRLSVDSTIESGQRNFYAVYRANTDIKVTKIVGNYVQTNSYSDTTATIAAAALDDVDYGDFQALKMALGVASNQTTVGVVYNKTQNLCYFKRISQNLSTLSNALQISTNACISPTIHFNPKSNRFIITYGEYNNNNKVEIKKTEITLSANGDSKSTPVIVRAATAGDMSAPNVLKLATDFYADGNWMAMFYHLEGNENIYVHGYHVSDK